MKKAYAFIDGYVEEKEILNVIGWNCPARVDYMPDEYGTVTVVHPLTMDKMQELIEWGFNTGKSIKYEPIN